MENSKSEGSAPITTLQYGLFARFVFCVIQFLNNDFVPNCYSSLFTDTQGGGRARQLDDEMVNNRRRQIEIRMERIQRVSKVIGLV